VLVSGQIIRRTRPHHTSEGTREKEEENERITRGRRKKEEEAERKYKTITQPLNILIPQHEPISVQ
jgi:hypothetical protein